MSLPAARILHDLYKAGHVLADPGDAGVIEVNKDLMICEMTVGASNQTRTLRNPTKAGIRFTLRLKSTSGGNVTVTASAGLDVALETQAIFATASNFLQLISVSLTATTFRWEVQTGNTGTVIASTSPSTSRSTSPSTSASSSPSTSPSPSASVSSSPSSSPSPSASVSSSPSSSPSAT